MIRLLVNLTFPGSKTVSCGEIVTTLPDPRGKIQGAFRYAPDYLNHPLAFPLDPVNLPLSSKEFQTDRPEGVHAVFEDALPDDWGRNLLIKKAMLGRGEQTIPRLLEILGRNGLGALSFESKQDRSGKPDPSAGIKDLETLLNAALRYESGLPLYEKELQLLYQSGSSPGGARPKALCRKEMGSLWIAKFPRHNDTFHVESIEAATLELAKRSGLPVPEFEIQDIGKRKVLLVRRFDISGHGGRYHMISMQTLLQAQGYYFLSYDDVFDVVKAHSYQPSIDIPLLFRQMIFNVAVGNTDDHLKNFCMLHKESGYCLSPVYDVLPDIYEKREHSLSFPFGAGFLPPDRNTLESMAAAHNIETAGQIIDIVRKSVSGWKNVFQQYKVPEFEIQRLEWSINRRIESLRKTSEA
ncbi:MAG: type II toxin-antitoxin system HipA family toxin [Desulfobacula sp.]|jgi:serine/threonine-protein kinase HipA|uniref:type II toxin-antitoxin system HipA family toxin n=1 Tax=Desulfobacula sp. TaxID=2593537 RepID=UPI001D5CE7B2|nr:type II toxin-antitoxin system HipA family toxin [Desulfobacula sp.]MBT3487065.1 type II toxin-antitoxin system HipA family toxin [Desulfobacula sp.]MBT3806839.1 type II toxin-antitoxin system HipA family toxin [Desulfobacula sp.]MBT4026782.1 type II toxin-antitoxin system HipA family toxin [Desulfobacula sp.]MBT4199045.1 type II toxin-antitoxin system HipA family toxin [Desulfobacula sp.]